ncbi:MAG: DMT family transporter [Micrococcus sp.]|nr:DMT family transporter [Micrococcus sp.]
MSRGTLAGSAAVLVTAVLWGTTGTAATFAPQVGPLAMGAAALGIGGLLQAAIAVPHLRREWAALTSQRGIVLAGALGVAIYPLAFYSSMHLAGVAVGTVVSLGSAPIVSGILEWIVERKRASAWWMAAAGVGLTGSAVLCVAKIQHAPADSGATAAGVVVGLLAGATYALYSWAAHRLMGSGVSRSASMGAVFGLGGAALIPVLAITGAPLLAGAQNLAVAAYMALVPMFLGYVLFGFGLTRVSASTATTITLVEPAVATVLALVIVGERLSLLGWLGLATIGLSLVLLAVAPAAHEPTRESLLQGPARARRRRPGSAPL